MQGVAYVQQYWDWKNNAYIGQDMSVDFYLSNQWLETFQQQINSRFLRT